MTKNSLIPKENKAQIVEIREIENQIPTYEEFLNNYSQEKANYDELTHEDISLNEGFGPCNWSNPRCSCQYGEKWTYLSIPCPVGGCGSRNIVNQTHTCGGQVEISNKARVQCRGCGTVGRVRDWNFSCSNHHGSYYSRADATSFVRSIMVAIRVRRIETDFADELLNYLEDNSF